MECTIGWIKIKDGFILFKNRDRRKEEPKENYFYKDENVITFEDKNSNRCWIGINKYGLGIASAAGPFREVPAGYQDDTESFKLNKDVLSESKTIEEATSLYDKLHRERKIGKSINIIICDKNNAKILELVLDKSNIQTANKPIFRVNNFETMKEYNIDPERTKRSAMRLNKFLELAKKIKEGKDLIPILKSHSEDPYGNICRHDASVTVGSAIFEVKDKEITVYSLLNESPCKGEYKREIFNNQTFK